MILRRGTLCWVDFGEGVGSEQGGMRPAVIVQNDIGNKYSPCTLVAPLTSQVKTNLPTHITIDKKIGGLSCNSTILTEQVTVIDKSRIKEIIGYISNEDIIRVNLALVVSFGLQSIRTR